MGHLISLIGGVPAFIGEPARPSMMARTKTVGLPALLLCFAAILVLGVWAKSADGIAEAAAEVPAGGGAAKRQPFVQLKPQDSWLLELCAVAFLAAFLVNMMVGRSRNEKLAVAWTTEVRCCLRDDRSTASFNRLTPAKRILLQLVAADGVLDRNFSLLGPGDTNVRSPRHLPAASAAAGPLLLVFVQAFCWPALQHALVLFAGGRGAAQGVYALFSTVGQRPPVLSGMRGFAYAGDVIPNKTLL